MLTLWDIMGAVKKRKQKRGRREITPGQSRVREHANGSPQNGAPVVGPAPSVTLRVPPPPHAGEGVEKLTMRERYELVTRSMLDAYGVRVRKWRSAMTGVAWQVTYKDGTVSRLIEAPRPRGPMSAAVFLHEIGHHAIGFGTYRPRCLEEYHAWRWSLEQMERQGLNITDPVHRRMRESLEYAVAKANRRGLKKVPDELVAYFARTEQYARKRAEVC